MTSTDLALPQHLLDHQTGELLDATPENAVALLGRIRETRRLLLDLSRECEAVLVEESRRQGTKTLRYPEGTATITGGSEIVWDIEVLEELRAAGLSEERFNALVVPTVSFKVDGRIVRQLEGSNERYREIIGRARKRDETSHRVSVR